MKIIFGIIAMIALTGCFESNDSKLKSQIKSLYEANNNLQKELSHCESTYNSLANQVAGGSSTFNPPPPVETAEPECEEVTYYTIVKDNKVIATCQRIEQDTCGISGEYCIDDYEYKCLTNVRIGAITKKECN